MDAEHAERRVCAVDDNAHAAGNPVIEKRLDVAHAGVSADVLHHGRSAGSQGEACQGALHADAVHANQGGVPAHPGGEQQVGLSGDDFQHFADLRLEEHGHQAASLVHDVAQTEVGQGEYAQLRHHALLEGAFAQLHLALAAFGDVVAEHRDLGDLPALVEHRKQIVVEDDAPAFVLHTQRLARVEHPAQVGQTLLEHMGRNELAHAPATHLLGPGHAELEGGVFVGGVDHAVAVEEECGIEGGVQERPAGALGVAQGPEDFAVAGLAGLYEGGNVDQQKPDRDRTSGIAGQRRDRGQGAHLRASVCLKQGFVQAELGAAGFAALRGGQHPLKLASTGGREHVRHVLAW